MQVSLNPSDIAPQSLHVFNFGFKELKPTKTNNNSKSGVKNNRIRILPRKLIKKLNPKIGIIINSIKKKVNKFLLALGK